MPTLLTRLFQYKAWANDELFAALKALDEKVYATEHRTALFILNHAHIVDRIFVANLQRSEHGYTATGTKEPPTLNELSEAARETDRWYIDYVSGLTSSELAEMLDFTFTDGQHGRMSREEMLAHVITHNGYHRGEVGRIMSQLSIPRPRDIFTGYLHKIEPARRESPQSAGIS
jgi:uncharacterized damage-inducible protein DinB